MATDLGKRQGPVLRRDQTHDRVARPDARWPFIATGVALLAVSGVAVLVLTQYPSPRPYDADRWNPTVEGMMTPTREGSGFVDPRTTTSTQSSDGFRAYVEEALTLDREGRGFVDPKETTLAQTEYGPRAYVDDALTEDREGYRTHPAPDRTDALTEVCER